MNIYYVYIYIKLLLKCKYIFQIIYIYFTKNNKIFFEMYTSIREEIARTVVITIENNVCLNISTLIFSCPLSFIIEL